MENGDSDFSAQDTAARQIAHVTDARAYRRAEYCDRSNPRLNAETPLRPGLALGHPVLNMEAWDPAELTLIIGNQD